VIEAIVEEEEEVEAEEEPSTKRLKRKKRLPPQWMKMKKNRDLTELRKINKLQWLI